MKYFLYFWLGLFIWALFGIIFIGGYSYLVTSEICSFSAGITSCIFKATDPATYGFFIGQPFIFRIVFAGVSLVMIPLFVSILMRSLVYGIIFIGRKIGFINHKPGQPFDEYTL